jgi:hypothetical protein
VTQCKIVISRNDGIKRDRIRKYRIILDDTEIGRIRAGESLSFDVDSGDHQLSLKIDWGASQTLTFATIENKVIEFGCEPLGGDAGALAAVQGSIDLWRIPSGYADAK